MNQLPQTRINENAIKAWKIMGLIIGFAWYLLPVIPILMYINKDGELWLPIVFGLLALSLHIISIFFFPKLRWSRWRYDVNESGVDIFRGIIIQKRTIIPLNRIQHVDTKQGPIYRKFGLSSLNISTAATTHEIPALDHETAAHLRTMISELVSKAKEDV